MQLSVTGLLLWPIKGANRLSLLQMCSSTFPWCKHGSFCVRVMKALIIWPPRKADVCAAVAMGTNTCYSSSHLVLSPPVTVELCGECYYSKETYANQVAHTEICICHDIIPWCCGPASYSAHQPSDLSAKMLRGSIDLEINQGKHHCVWIANAKQHFMTQYATEEQESQSARCRCASYTPPLREEISYKLDVVCNEQVNYRE